MNHTWIIAARELRERGRVFVICGVLAALPFLATLLPGAHGHRADVIAVLGGFLSLTAGLGLALLLGISTVSGELAQRRMSFFFAKPVSATALWFGKAIGALVISLGCFALIALPAYLVSPKAWRLHWLGAFEPLSIAALAIAGLFFLSHFLSSILRSRSILLALDFACLVILVGGLSFLLRALLLGGAVEMAKTMLVVFGVIVALTLVIAPVWQLANGRTDLRRSHAALSRFVWLGLGGALLIGAAFVTWIASFGPGQLRGVDWIEEPTAGGAALVSGSGTGRGDYVATFLIDTKSGAYRRVPLPPWAGATFSRDGQTLYGLKPVGFFGVRFFELHVTTVADGRRADTGITVPMGGSIQVSGDAKRVAVIADRNVSVFNIADGRLLVSAPIDPNLSRSAFFLTPDILRIVEYDLSGDSGVFRVLELDVQKRFLRKTGEQEAKGVRGDRVTISADGTRMHFRGTDQLLDGRTGEPVAVVPATKGTTRGVMLHDGAFALLSQASGPVHLQLFSRDGLPLHDLVVPGVETAYFVGEIAGDRLMLTGLVKATGTVDPTGKGRRMFVIDLRQGTIELTVAGIRGPRAWWSYAPILPRYAADQPLVGVNGQGKLVTWDPRTGVVRPVKTR